MTILDRYCTKEFLRYLLIIIISLVSLYLLVDFFGRVRMFISNGATIFQICSFFLFSIPMFIWQILPASILMASFVAFGSLSRSNEIMAMKACGISLYRIALPIIIIALFLSGFSFVMSEFVTPTTNQKAKRIKLVDIQKQESLGTFKENQIWFRAQDSIYNIKVFNPRLNNLQGITIYQVDKNMRLLKRIDAAEGKWNKNKWILSNVILTTFKPNSFPVLEKFATQDATLPIAPEDLKDAQKEAENMGYRELRKYIREIQSSGYDATSYLVDLYGKVAFPFANIILAVIGFASSLQGRKSTSKTQGFAAGVIIGFSYWIVFAFAISLGKAEVLSPLLAAWIANIIFGFAAGALFLRIRT